ncbi:MAG: type II toxin-antitoxin system HicA family toxin [bacterium]
MSRHEKLKEKLTRLPRNFTYKEMVSLLRGFGYVEEERRRFASSAVMFYNQELNDKIMFHKPHPEKELKRYILEMIIIKLKNNQML